MKLEELEQITRKMRELGMTRFKEGDLEIELGPAPQTKSARDPREVQAEQEERRLIQQRDTMFAASHIKPKLRLAKGGG